jgi:hypothetical protein
MSSLQVLNGSYNSPYIVVPVEIGSWGSGFVSTTGAINTATNSAFTLTCTNNVANLKVRTNYMLVATNNNFGNPANYLRTLEIVTDAGNFGTQQTVNPPTNPIATGLGQSMCVNNNAVTFTFPAVTGTSIAIQNSNNRRRNLFNSNNSCPNVCCY